MTEDYPTPAGPPTPPAEALAARSLLEQVARMGDRIGQHTVGEIRTISDQAAAWLKDNPPGQPVAIEPALTAEPQGEVAELVNRLGWIEAQLGDINWLDDAEAVRRTAELLKRQQPVPPAVGEVAEVRKWLRSRAGMAASPDFPAVIAYLTRAADLLERQQPVPVAVSERLPGAGDCDAEGRCWWWRTDDADEWWELLGITDAREHNARCGSARYTHWLPAHALPIPRSGKDFD